MLTNCKKVLNFDPKIPRYSQLTPIIDQPPPVAKPRLVKKQVTTEYTESLKLKPNIKELTALMEKDYQSKSTNSIYCAPVAMTMGVPTYSGTFLSRLMKQSTEPFTADDIKPV